MINGRKEVFLDECRGNETLIQGQFVKRRGIIEKEFFAGEYRKNRAPRRSAFGIV